MYMHLQTVINFFFKSLFDTLATEIDGICICGGDFNVVLNLTMDTTSLKNNKNKLTKLINTAWEDIFFFMSGGMLIHLRRIILTIRPHTQYMLGLIISSCKKMIVTE